ncbi:hypothetical protein O1M63_46160 [Streptomyces mirabilis]|nr:hypothetical protein [Streptomyces mirabilis]
MPNPEEKTPEPLSLVVAQVPLADAAPPFCGGTDSVSSVVVPPAVIAPESSTSLGVVDSWSSSIRVVSTALRVTLVAVLPPSGPTAALVYSLVPSFDETTMVMPYCCTMDAITACWTGSSSR